MSKNPNPNQILRNGSKFSGIFSEETTIFMICKVCNVDKELNEFYAKNKSMCKRCKKIDVYNWRIANRERVLQQRRETYRKYKDKIDLQNREWELRNREKVASTHKTWKKNNKDKVKEYKHVRRSREYGKGDRIYAKEWRTLLGIVGDLCLSCQSENITLDHIVPLCKNGRNIITNAQPLCLSCNDKKGTKTIDYRSKQQIQIIQSVFQSKETIF